jgi:hypothetical protein
MQNLTASQVSDRDEYLHFISLESSLGFAFDFDSTIRVFKSSDQTLLNGYYQRMSVSVACTRFERTGHCLQIVERERRCDKIWNPRKRLGCSPPIGKQRFICSG